MNANELNEMFDQVLPLCDDLNGSSNHLMDWMTAGNKDGVFNGKTAAEIAEMWNTQMAEYRNEQSKTE